MKTIPYGRQQITESDVQAVEEVMWGDWLTQGPTVSAFEEQVARYCHARYAVAVSHGTAALQLVCQALGLGAGDGLWTSPITFAASANCGRYCGATVNFVDIEREGYNLSPAALELALQNAAVAGTLPKILIPVHFAGLSCDMEAIHALAKRYGVAVVEDGCHALGGKYQGQPMGDCRYSDAVVFSFHPVKSITTGEGGMVVTNRQDLYEKLLLLRSHGITRDPALMAQPSHGPWFYDQVELSYNFRLTDIQAALGISQLQRLDDFVAKREALVARYNKMLAQMPLILPHWSVNSGSANHLYVVRLQGEWTANRAHLFDTMREEGIGVNVHYIPVHLLTLYRRLGFAPGDFPQAEWYYEGALTLPLHPSLSEVEQNRVVAALQVYFDRHTPAGEMGR